MKKRLLFFALPLVALLSFSSCGDDDENVNDAPGSVDANGYEYVDLGLPSGTMWATMNVGAKSIKEYGSLFAWGELTEYVAGDSHSFFVKEEGEHEGKFSKYVWKCDSERNDGFYDNKAILDLSDDVAHARMGGEWRMPTIEEWHELLEHCSSSLSTYDGVGGYLLTAKNGNTLFLPFAGAAEASEPEYFGVIGHYWSSSLGKELWDGQWDYSSYWACSIYFDDTCNKPDDYGWDFDGQYRPEGAASVRAVCPSRK